MPAEEVGKIVDLQKNNGKILARIETNLLYPGGGGQPNDHAWVTQNNQTFFLTEVEEFLGVPYWVLPEQSFVPGDITILRDDLWRLELSQQHTAQHILSGLAFSKFGWPSDGFTIFPAMAKIEFVGADMDPEKYGWLEKETNQVIGQGLPVDIYEAPSTDETRKGIQGDMQRIVEIKGIDKCGCGGTHLNTTLEVGGFSILGFERKNKESIRVTFAAGLRLAQIAKHYKSWEDELKKKLNGDIEERIEALLKDADRSRETEKALLNLMVTLIPTQDLVRLEGLPLSRDAIKYLSIELNQKGCSSFLTNQEGYFVLSGEQAKPIWEDLRSKGAKGGGQGVITGRLNQ